MQSMIQELLGEARQFNIQELSDEKVQPVRPRGRPKRQTKKQRKAIPQAVMADGTVIKELSKVKVQSMIPELFHEVQPGAFLMRR